MNKPLTPSEGHTTICAPATPQAVGALAVIRLSGPQAIEIASKVFHSSACPDLTQSPGYKIWYGTVTGPDGNHLDDVLISVFKAPLSYTGEDSVEFSCHGSLYIREALLQTLVQQGAVLAGHGEFTQRAFMNGKIDLTQAEAVADLIASENRTTHKLALDQMAALSPGSWLTYGSNCWNWLCLWNWSWILQRKMWNLPIGKPCALSWTAC